jgi:hypothetical protein
MEYRMQKMNLLQDDRREAWLVAALLMVLAFGLFANTFGHAWTFDDFMVIVKNPDVRSIRGFLADSYPGRPLREITYLLDHALFGMEPAGWHVQSIFWHGLNAGLLFVLLRRLKASRAVAWIASLLFLVHPIQVEVVANISHRKDSLALAFSLLALLAYTEAFRPDRKRPLWIGGALLLTAVASLAKQTAVVLPVIFAVHEAFLPAPERLFFKTRARVIAAVSASFLALAGWYAYALSGKTFLVLATSGLSKMNYSDDVTVGVYFATILKALSVMFLKFFWPVDLAVEYVIDPPGSWFSPWVVGALAGILALACGFFFFLRRSPLAAFAIAWMALFWLPTANLLWPLAYFAADRYLYAPAAGFFILAALAIDRTFHRKRSIEGVVVLGCLAVLAVLTWQQNQVWRSEVSLFAQAVKVSPQSTPALIGLGTACMNEGELVSARETFRKAALNFNDSKPLHLLALVSERLGDKRGALRYYQSFVSMNDPRYQADIQNVKRYVRVKYGVAL